MTLICALSFVIGQVLEFSYLNFSIKDGAYSQSFYSLVGLHGLHACIGLLFLVWLVLIYIYSASYFIINLY